MLQANPGKTIPKPAAAPAPEIEAAAPDQLPAAAPGWLRETPFWALSLLLHLILFALLLNVFISAPAETAALPIRIEIRTDVVPPREPERPRNLFERPRTLQPELPVLSAPTPEPEAPRGKENEDRESIVDHRSANWESVVGIGGPPSGPGGRGPGADGAPAASFPVIEAALEWLKRHQHPDGSWRSREFTEVCKKTCANRNPQRHGDGRGFPGHDAGVTGLAMLAFAGYGHTHQDGIHPEWRQALLRAVRYLKSVQVRSDDPNTNGRFGPAGDEQWIYDHAIATLAMAELLVMSGDEIGLRRSVTDAVQLCLHARNPGFGWKYGIQPGRNDTSVTGWMVLALKTARNARIDIPRETFDEAFEGALEWFDRATSVATGKTGYEVPGDEGSRLARAHPEPYPYSKELSCMTAVAVLCRLFAGENRNTPVIKRGVDILMQETPQWNEAKGNQLSKINMYYWYYASYAMFQFGGTLWKKWNDDMLKALLTTQRQGDIDEDGSWDPIGEWGIAGGRVYSTAIGAMTLEVYYRYVRVAGTPTPPIRPPVPPR